MTSKTEYKEKINSASPLQLTIINYELLLGCLDDAASAAPKSPACEEAASKARACLAELHAALNMDVDFSQDLEAIYLYINRLIIHAAMKRDSHEKNALLKEARELVAGLLEAWQHLESEEHTPRHQAPQIFAGLTYGKDGSLNEYHDPGSKLDKKM